LHVHDYKLSAATELILRKHSRNLCWRPWRAARWAAACAG